MKSKSTKSEKTNPPAAKKRPLYSVNRLSELLGSDRRTLKKALEDYDDPDGNGAFGPLYTKWKAVSALLHLRRKGADPTAPETMSRLLYGCCHGAMASEACMDALARYDLARWRGVSPEDLTESID